MEIVRHDEHRETRAARLLIAQGRVEEGLEALGVFARRRKSAVAYRILVRYADLASRSDVAQTARSTLAALGIEAFGDDFDLRFLDPYHRGDQAMRGLLGYALRTPDLGPARLYMRWLRGRQDEARRILKDRAQAAQAEKDPRQRAVNNAACAYAAMSLGDLDRMVEHAACIDLDDSFLRLPPELADFVRPCLWSLPRSVAEARPIWSRRMRAPLPSKGDVKAERPLILVEGAFAAQTAAGLIARAYPETDRLAIGFLTRPPGMIQAFQEHFAQEPRWTTEFPDLLIDHTGNYVPFIRVPSALAGVAGERAFRALLRSVGSSERRLSRLFEEPLTLAFDDHIYRYLRVARALEGILRTGGYDNVLVISATGTYMFAALTLARQQLGVERVRFALLGRSPPLQARLADVARRAMLGRTVARPAPTPFVPLDAFRRTPVFTRAGGPIAPGKGARSALLRMAFDVMALRLSPTQRRRDRAAREFLLAHATWVNAEAGRPERFHGADWLAANLDARIYGGLAADLARKLAARGPLVFIDYAAPESPAARALIEELRADGRVVLTINYRAFMRQLDLRLAGLGKARSLALSQIFPARWRRDFPMQIGEPAMRMFLLSPMTALLRSVSPLHLNVGCFAWATTRWLRAARLYAFPTRNTYMRVFTQGARLAGVPSIEAQTVLGGRMVRHRAPNTDRCSVLETWSRDYYVDYLGYPREGLLCGGSNRYDALMRRSRLEMTAQAVEEARLKACGDDLRPIVLFGSQPMQMTDNLAALDWMIEALGERDDIQIVVKTHPAEPPASAAVYAAAGARRPRLTLRVVSDVDVYALMQASKVVCAQTSNILIEAALLKRRAVALHSGDFEPPIDFAQMGCARVAKTPHELAQELDAALNAAPGEAAIDAMQARFLSENPQMLDERFIERILECGSELRPRGWLTRAGDFFRDLRAPLEAL